MGLGVLLARGVSLALVLVQRVVVACSRTLFQLAFWKDNIYFPPLATSQTFFSRLERSCFGAFYICHLLSVNYAALSFDINDEYGPGTGLDVGTQ